jgi:general secretion pathway protein N
MMRRQAFFVHAGRRAAPFAPWGWATLGALLGLLITLVWFAPAVWLASAVASATAGQVQLVDARGTAWTGSARLVLAGGAGSRDRAALPGRLDWQLRPAWGGFGVQVSADCCTPAPVQARVSTTLRGVSVQLSDASSQWPAGLLAGLGTPWNTLQAEGSLLLATQGVTLAWFEGRLTLGGRTELQALGMSSRLSTLQPMGSYRVTLTGGPTPLLELSTIQGSLQLSGTGHWVGPRLRFEGVASAAPEHEAALANLLNIIGRRNGARSIITLG